MYAVMLETDYMKKPLFLKNFWAGFKDTLGRGHVIQSLEKCDFRPIYDHLMADRERKKGMTKAVSGLRRVEAVLATPCWIDGLDRGGAMAPGKQANSLLALLRCRVAQGKACRLSV
jgi:hypothetical protein